MSIVLLPRRAAEWVVAKRRFRRRRFALDGRFHRYFAAMYNVTFLNERAVEIPLARELVARFSPEDVLEVGHVLGHYQRTRHTCVDKYERARGVINEDIVGFSPGRTYRAIVSVSTLEHVGWDEVEREPQKLTRALRHLRGLLAPDGAMLVTMPLGYNHFLDACVAKDALPFERVLFMKRQSADNRWSQAGKDEVEGVSYGRPFRNANAIIIGLVGS